MIYSFINLCESVFICGEFLRVCFYAKADLQKNRCDYRLNLRFFKPFGLYEINFLVLR